MSPVLEHPVLGTLYHEAHGTQRPETGRKWRHNVPAKTASTEDDMVKQPPAAKSRHIESERLDLPPILTGSVQCSAP